jgi:O-acetyl-ADP-ribose deacetylase (regulator of RNase III)
MYVFNFPTKKHWRDPSQLNWIAEGLDDLRRCVVNLNLNSISIPALGCGYGGLQFEDVSKLVDEKLSDLNTYILLYKPA